MNGKDSIIPVTDVTEQATKEEFDRKARELVLAHLDAGRPFLFVALGERIPGTTMNQLEYVVGCADHDVLPLSAATISLAGMAKMGPQATERMPVAAAQSMALMVGVQEVMAYIRHQAEQQVPRTPAGDAGATVQ
jgi:hypothetical protein